MIPAPVAAYLRKRGVRSWTISGSAEPSYSGAVIIPALAESPRLFHTLASLAANPPELLERLLVLVVVNHREDAPAEDKADNEATLRLLERGCPELSMLDLAWIDAASPGKEMPAKGGGVGLARKIGADLALPCLDYAGSTPLLIYLDADTLVEPGYLAAIEAHFKSVAAGGAVIPFRHQRPPTIKEQQAIDTYELFLRSFVVGLEIAGSPYAFHTVGSAMACRAVDYARMGGMNTRAAGEDFYFLQQLHRVAGVSPLRGTVVHPSPRASHRVPFGTGRSMSRTLAGDEQAVVFHRPECFLILKEWLTLIAGNPDADSPLLMDRAAELSPQLAIYLVQAGFSEAWSRLRQNNKCPMSLRKAFHDWFDGLKTMKLIHHLSATIFPCCGPDQALPELLKLAGEPSAAGVTEQLEALQRRQFAR
ncbi:glycosyltransferase family 2 protein [Geotalea sp. SG265]|uniref:glycosyltransferase family 2 protein n=1 Tax=Geotalea sp. SG265 TaxID=2922867 RepID=UPI001FAF9E40|nr:glycosyltransferase family 2 protein [Geotalea sp. SG265]